jgi:sulfate transport system ATP-binding protein
MEVANKVVIMNNGQIEQVGNPADIYGSPNNMFVYDFLGNYNDFKGWRGENGKLHYLSSEYHNKINNHDQYDGKSPYNLYSDIGNFINKICFGLFTKKSENQNNVCDITDQMPGAGDKLVNILVRPYEIEVTKNKDENYQYITCTVYHLHPSGFSVNLELISVEKQSIRAEISKDDCEKMAITKGDTVYIRPKNFRIFD